MNKIIETVDPRKALNTIIALLIIDSGFKLIRYLSGGALVREVLFLVWPLIGILLAFGLYKRIYWARTAAVVLASIRLGLGIVMFGIFVVPDPKLWIHWASISNAIYLILLVGIIVFLKTDGIKFLFCKKA